jgi:hypothetical protein
MFAMFDKDSILDEICKKREKKATPINSTAAVT